MSHEQQGQKGTMEESGKRKRRDFGFVGININTILTTFVLSIVLYLAKVVTTTNERVIVLEVQVGILKDQVHELDNRHKYGP